MGISKNQSPAVLQQGCRSASRRGSAGGATRGSSSRCDRHTIKIIKKFAHSMRSQVRCPAELISPRSIAEGRNDRCGYARVYQTVPHALRDLSPLSAAAVIGISECMAQRPGLTGCAWAKPRLSRLYEAGLSLMFEANPWVDRRRSCNLAVSKPTNRQPAIPNALRPGRQPRQRQRLTVTKKFNS
jgi:hypothetical protein